ncbi:MAG: hypothetical protein M0R51_09985 [Clostridia bacterium]|nr:hypothetical protein [Clostridia bacterium]
MSSGVCIIVAKDEARKLLNETAEYKGTIFNVIEVDLKKKGIAFEQGPTIE